MARLKVNTRPADQSCRTSQIVDELIIYVLSPLRRPVVPVARKRLTDRSSDYTTKGYAIFLFPLFLFSRRSVANDRLAPLGSIPFVGA